MVGVWTRRVGHWDEGGNAQALNYQISGSRRSQPQISTRRILRSIIIRVSRLCFLSVAIVMSSLRVPKLVIYSKNSMMIVDRNDHEATYEAGR